MQVTMSEFISSPALYLAKIDYETVIITDGSRDIAVLSKPKTPIADSLVGILKDLDIKDTSDIKKMRLDT